MDRYQTALLAHQTGNLTEALTIYQEILQTNPQHADVLHLISILYAQQNDFVTACNYMEAAVRLTPNSASYQNSLGNIYKNLQEFPKALQAYQRALQLAPNYAVAYNNLANVYYQLGQLEEAIQHYRNAIWHHPNYTDAYCNLGLALMATNPQEALVYFNRTLQLDPQHATAHTNLGHIYQLQGETTTALQHFYRALKSNPLQIQAHHHLGVILSARNKYSAALRHFNKILLLDPKHPEALHNAGAIFLIQHNTSAALKYFLRLLQLKPQDAVTLYNLGVIYMDLGHFKDALYYFKEALQFYPNPIPIYTNLGAIYLKQEDYLKAKETYTTILTLDPSHQEASYLLSALNHQNLPSAPTNYIQNLFNQYANTYEQHLALLDYQVPNLIYEALSTYYAIKQPTDLTILDLGCGTGLCGTQLRPFANKLIGIDLASKMLTQAQQKKTYDELKQLSLLDALKEYHNMDLIIAADTLVYLGDLAEFFTSSYQSLTPQGLLVFTIETTHTYPYVLQKTARFAHAPQYITELAEHHNFTIESSANIILRKHKTTNITGKLYLLAKKH